MLAETMTRLEMSWKKLLRTEKGDREKLSAKRGPGENGWRENEIAEQGEGGEGLTTYVIRGEKTELKARYHLSGSKWYSDVPRLFFTWVDFTTRDITLPLPPLHPPFSPPHHRQPSTLGGCGLLPATFTSLFPSTYANEIDILQTLLSLPHLLYSCHRALNRCL